VAVGLRSTEALGRKYLGLPRRPYKLLLELTLECNSRCGSCAIWKTPARIKKQQLTLAEIEAMFTRSGRDLVWLALSGGEVTRYEAFPEVVALAKRLCPGLRVVTFTTNGLLPEIALRHAVAVERAGFDAFVTISLDGDADTHDRLRGVPGNHALAWEAYQLLRSHGINVQFGITLSDQNEAFVENEYVHLRDKIKAVTILHDDGIYGHANPHDEQDRRPLPGHGPGGVAREDLPSSRSHLRRGGPLGEHDSLRRWPHLTPRPSRRDDPPLHVHAPDRERSFRRVSAQTRQLETGQRATGRSRRRALPPLLDELLCAAFDLVQSCDFAVARAHATDWGRAAAAPLGRCAPSAGGRRLGSATPAPGEPGSASAPRPAADRPFVTDDEYGCRIDFGSGGGLGRSSAARPGDGA
jgi:pyruvate-formate lyase-activating enzyme